MCSAARNIHREGIQQGQQQGHQGETEEKRLLFDKMHQQLPGKRVVHLLPCPSCNQTL